MTVPILGLALGDGADAGPWLDALRSALPDLVVEPLAAVCAEPSLRYVAAWRHRHGALAGLSNLSAIFSLGAGVDHLLADDTLPNVPIVRVADPDLTGRMTEWVVLHVLMHHRQQRLYDFHQYEKIWENDLAQPAAKDVRVGVMGLGNMGLDAVRALQTLGFNVAGWSRRPKSLPGCRTFAGSAQLGAFLAHTQILVVLLPLTPETRSLLDRPLFEQLARDSHFGGPILINAGRGGLQNEDAILACLDDGTLRAATLDVFITEPLPATSPLWHHPAVTISPHNAAISDPDAVAGYIGAAIASHEQGTPFQHVVDRVAGY